MSDPIPEINVSGRIPKPAIAQATAQQRFQAMTNAIKEHYQLLDSKPLHRGFDFALRAMQEKLTGHDMNTDNASAIAFKLAGAQEFIDTFRALADQAEPEMPILNRDSLPKPKLQRAA